MLFLNRLDDGDRDDDSDDGKDNEGKNEAYPSLLACRTCRVYSLVGVLKTTTAMRSVPLAAVCKYSPKLGIFLNRGSSRFYDIDRLVLLLHQNAHL